MTGGGIGSSMTRRAVSRRRWRLAWSGAWFSSFGFSSMAVTTVCSSTNRVRSSMWPSVSSPAIPSPSQMISVTPRKPQRRCSICSRVRFGLRLGLSKQLSVVSNVPAPLTSMDPPSSTIWGANISKPRAAAICVGIWLSKPKGGYFSPHALYSQLMMARVDLFFTNTGP